MVKRETRTFLEKKEHIKNKLVGYKFTKHDPLSINSLKIGNFVKWIKKTTDHQEAHVVHGGRIDDITEDNQNPGYIYRLTVKTNTGIVFKLKLKGADAFFLYYKEKPTKEVRADKAIEWKKQLDPVEKARLTMAQKKRKNEKDKTKQKKITDGFYEWLYKRKPHLDPKRQNIN